MRFVLVLFCILLGMTPWRMLSAAADGHDNKHHHHHAHEDETDAPETAELDSAENSRLLMLLIVYCSLIVLASLAGGWLPNWVQLTHTRMQTLISGVGGLMLGIAVFHLLPHSLEYTTSPKISSQWLMGGLLVMFFLVRAFHFHHHGPADPLAEETPHHDHDHDHDHDDGHHHHHDHSHAVHHLNWIGVALGLAIHTMIDGIALGASVRAEIDEPVFLSLCGVGTFLAVLLHKPLDAISITSLMAAGGWSAGARNAVNAGFALMCPLGALAFVFGLEQLNQQQHFVIGCALAFAAGVFLCISLGDLLPELELHAHNRIRLTIALLLGVVLAWAIEQTHSHDHPHTDSHHRSPETQQSRDIPA